MNVRSGNWTYLEAYLAPLAPFLARDDVTDLYVNRPGELWVETLGGATETITVPTLTDELLKRLAHQVAAYSSQGLNRSHPLLSAALPEGSRIQIAVPPATPTTMIMAIRKHLPAALSLTDYVNQGAFEKVAARADGQGGVCREAVQDALSRQDVQAALATAVKGRLNILVSGGTSTGKTTFLNALIREIPGDERLVTIEDTPELTVAHPNAVSLLAVRGALGEADVTADDLVTASLRLRPDRILLGELRGPEAFAFLRAINTGHPGSMSTIHANSTTSAVDQLALLVLQAGSRLSRADVRDIITGTIDVYVQLDREGGRRLVTQVICPDRTAIQ